LLVSLKVLYSLRSEAAFFGESMRPSEQNLNHLASLLWNVFGELGDFQCQWNPRADESSDFRLISTEWQQFELDVRVRERVTPQTADDLFARIRGAEVAPDVVQLVYAPVISPRVAEIARRHGVSYMDKVDLVSGEYAQGERLSAITVNELSLNTLRGIDLAFECCEEITIKGPMPDGGSNTVRARVVRPEAYILIKAFALADRMKDKDAYDVAFVLNHYRPTLTALAERVAPIVSGGLGAEAFAILMEKFAERDAVGPQWAADLAVQEGQNRDQAKQAAFLNAQDLFEDVERILTSA